MSGPYEVDAVELWVQVVSVNGLVGFTWQPVARRLGVAGTSRARFLRLVVHERNKNVVHHPNVVVTFILQFYIDEVFGENVEAGREKPSNMEAPFCG